MKESKAINYQAVIPETLTSLAEVHQVMAEQGLNPKLSHLISLRASQMNACGFCVNMHVREALDDGESHERLHRLIVWRESRDFTEAERAAFAWTEALTDLSTHADMDALRSQLREHYSDQQIGILTIAIGMINLWNRINVSRH